MKRVKNVKVLLSAFLLYGLLVTLWFGFSCREANATEGLSVETIARQVCEGIGIVGKAAQGTKGAPILILEENHASRAGQIEHAIALVRLHERHGLKHIALEGYLRESPEIQSDWFLAAARGLSFAARARVVVRLLKEGEISNAEFMKLVYEDIALCPIETADEYSVELPQEAATVPFLYLLKIAQQSLEQKHVPRLQELQNDIEKLKGKEDGEAYQKKVREMFDYILSADSWARDKAKVFQDKDSIRSMSGEEHVTLVEEIVNRAKRLAIELEPEEKRAMERYLAFWRGRVSASKTMVLSAAAIADRPETPVVAMAVGAAHTEGMCAMLKKADRSFAVITPLN